MTIERPMPLHNSLESYRRVPRLIVWGAQTFVIAASAFLAFVLRFDLRFPYRYLSCLLWCMAVWLLVKSLVFGSLGLDRGWWRYASTDHILRLALGNFIASVISVPLIIALVPVAIPRSIYPLDCMVCFLGTAGIRVAIRMFAEIPPADEGPISQRRAIIYGAGEAGVMLLREIQRNPGLACQVVGFVDDLPAKNGLVLQGLKVLGPGESIAALAAKHRVDIVLIAIPSASGAQMTRFVELCHSAGVECKTVPGPGDMIEGRANVGQIRSVEVEDLLDRSPIAMEEDRIRESIQGQPILVTGAGGSIGSELCRQLARFGPSKIVGLDWGESAVFSIEQEMRTRFPQIPFSAEVGSIQSPRRVEEIIARHSPAVVYHTAAYKHVPLMEMNLFEAFENNIFGTYNVALASGTHGVGDFVLISTDKAVSPASVMGATKRLAELLVMEMPARRTKFVVVRFGNVLGSAGSVIPIFKAQIAAGGPVTVTHPDMRRFFMTIPEACQLVLQAATIAQKGDICVPEMGEPVRIVDLARKLILLSGLKPDQDIRIEFTGVRPGEKLREELYSTYEKTTSTQHGKIRLFTDNRLNRTPILPQMNRLREICNSRDTGELILAMTEILGDYSPSASVLRNAVKPVETIDRTPEELASCQASAGVLSGLSSIEL